MAYLRSARLSAGRIGPVAGQADPKAGPIPVTSIYVVPGGHRAVVREMLFYPFNGPATGTFRVYLFLSGGGYTYIYGDQAFTLNKSYRITAQTVLNPGDSLRVDSSMGGLDYVISGALLIIPN